MSAIALDLTSQSSQRHITNNERMEITTDWGQYWDPSVSVFETNKRLLVTATFEIGNVEKGLGWVDSATGDEVTVVLMAIINYFEGRGWNLTSHSIAFDDVWYISAVFGK